MLTADLLRARPYRGRIRCQLLDPDDPDVLSDARFLVDLLLYALEAGETRGSIEEVVEGEAQIRSDHKILRGLAKVLLDTTTFHTRAPLPPAELRRILFERAARRAPLASGPNPFGRTTTGEVVAEVAQELGLEPHALLEALYADRKKEQRPTGATITDPVALIHRYNVALVQSVLLRATQLTVWLERPPPARIRQLLRLTKFHRLMHTARLDGEHLVLTVDGPASVLKRSTRYGLQLASFFPAVLHLERWRMEAAIDWKGRSCTLELGPALGLVPHVRDVGGYEPRESVWFRERFPKVADGWTLEPARLPIDLGGHAVVMPDFRFHKDGREAHMEIVGFWRRSYLERRVAWLRDHGPGNLLLAISNRLVAGDAEMGALGVEVVRFSSIIPARKVREVVERIARPVGA